jgi:hypothetical protein
MALHPESSFDFLVYAPFTRDLILENVYGLSEISGSKSRNVKGLWLGNIDLCIEWGFA